MLTAVLLAGPASAVIATEVDRSPPEKTWTSPDGSVGIVLPSQWQPATGEDHDTPWADTGQVLLRVAREDGQGTLVVKVFPDSLLQRDMHAFESYLALKCREAGREDWVPSATFLGDRYAAITEGQWKGSGRSAYVDIGLTHVDGRPLLFLFTSTGADVAAVSLEAKLALCTVAIDDDAFDPRGAREATAPVAADTVPAADPAPAAAPATGDPEPVLRQIPGSGVTLEVPGELLESLLQPGFVSMDGRTSIYVVHSPLPVRMARSGFSSETFRRQLGDMRSIEDLVVNGRKCTLALVAYQTATGTLWEWLLLTGDDKSSLTAHGRYHEGTPGMSESIMRRTLLSLTWDPDVGPNSLDGLSFTFTTGNRLTVTSRAHGRVVLTPPGQSVPISTDGTLLLIGRTCCVDPGLDLETVARQSAEQSRLVGDIEVSSTREITTGAGPGFELTGTAKVLGLGQKCDFYLAVVVKDRHVFYLEGLQAFYAVNDMKAEFARVAAGLRVP